MTTKHHPTPQERDERVSVPLPPEVAIPAFLAVYPSSQAEGEPAAGTDADAESEPAKDR